MNTQAFHAKDIGMYHLGLHHYKNINDMLMPQLDGTSLIAVISGYHLYNTIEDRIEALDRGASDYTASVVGRALDAILVENWTDTNGIQTADPRIVGNTRRVSHLTPFEARELSISGAKVLHYHTLLPLAEKGIPLVVKNAFEPDAEGTYISQNKPTNSHVVEAIAHKKGYVIVTMQKMGIDDMRRLVGLVGDTFERYQIPIRQATTGVDSVSLAIEEKDVDGNLQEAIDYLVGKGVGDKDRVIYRHNMALVSVVGEGMQNAPGVLGKIFGSIGRYGISSPFQFTSERSVLFAVNQDRAEEAVRIVHDAYFGNAAVRCLKNTAYLFAGKNFYRNKAA